MWIHCILKRQNELFIPPGKQLFPKWDRKPVLTLSKQSGSGKGSAGASGELVIWSGAHKFPKTPRQLPASCVKALGWEGGGAASNPNRNPYFMVCRVLQGN